MCLPKRFPKYQWQFVLPCQKFADFINGRCVCRQGYQEVRGLFLIITCNNNQRWDENTRQCIQLCPSDKIWDGNFCVCPNGLQNINGLCQQQSICRNN
jgi:hypothetical protein